MLLDTIETLKKSSVWLCLVIIVTANHLAPLENTETFVGKVMTKLGLYKNRINVAVWWVK